MTSRPIIFSAPMVRAILEGRKTQTRRVLTPRNTLFDGSRWPNYLHESAFIWSEAWVDQGPSPAGNAGPYLKLPVHGIACDPRHPDEQTVHRIYPKFAVGDRLWVKEGFSYWADPASAEAAQAIEGTDDPCVWRADYRDGTSSIPIGGSGWRSPRFMPRRFSRITLTVTEVRVQRLQEISEEDARAEGVEDGGCTECGGSSLATDGFCYNPSPDFRESFSYLWNSINGPEAWGANPWVVAPTFTSAMRNIDHDQ